MEKQVTVKTLIWVITSVAIPLLAFFWNLNYKVNMNEINSTTNTKNILEIRLDQKDNKKDQDKNFDKVLEKLHEIDVKLQNKQNRK